ncbi:FeoB-associated Cys-rich membrane protein [Heyndrickxia acidiproducens]|uniref:FeoB-associated Cys-rich membrane protein n=1 Tax=Heyndrickxia acidiproducens TaxID=1121084 RepID=UPI00036C502B|nr:FeoB-associated Cys-rich membrane protein [Heyndrickxia acidiproducens]
MFFSIILGIGIFAYAAFTLTRAIKKSREGQCASCALKKNCARANCCYTPEDAATHPDRTAQLVKKEKIS